MKKFMLVASVIIAILLVHNLQEPYGLYAVVALLIVSMIMGAIIGFFAYLFFMSYFRKIRKK
ncbi:MAG TPA: hypothetical protein VFT51_13030 [Bacillales bacterium]|nr:hypothetical protein [Bacillales bacterium]